MAVSMIRRGALFVALIVASPDVFAAETEIDWLSLHGQFTNVTQYHPSFTSPFQGANSLEGHAQTKETVDATLFAGMRLLDGLEVYVNPEIDQGFGLSNTLGLAGFSSGEAYKVGKANPYFRLQRAFARYTLNLGGDNTSVADAANQLGGQRSANSLVITAGKFSPVDIFDTNAYARDPRSDFFTWSIGDSGAYGYAADAWGWPQRRQQGSLRVHGNQPISSCWLLDEGNIVASQ